MMRGPTPWLLELLRRSARKQYPAKAGFAPVFAAHIHLICLSHDHLEIWSAHLCNRVQQMKDQEWVFKWTAEVILTPSQSPAPPSVSACYSKRFLSSPLGPPIYMQAQCRGQALQQWRWTQRHSRVKAPGLSPSFWVFHSQSHRKYLLLLSTIRG